MLVFLHFNFSQVKQGKSPDLWSYSEPQIIVQHCEEVGSSEQGWLLEDLRPEWPVC